MPDELPQAPIPSIPFRIGEELSSPSKKMPPAKIVFACIAVLGVIVGGVAFLQRPHSLASGSIDTVTAADVPNQKSVLVAINISILNGGETAYIVRSIKVDLKTNAGDFSDQPAPASDYARYYQGFPELKKAPLEPLKAEDIVAPGASRRGTIIVIFPLSLEAFASRQSLKVTLQPFDQPVPLVLSEISK